MIKVTISGGDLSAPINRDIFYRPGKPIVVPDNGELKLRLNIHPQTGTFDGSFIHPSIGTQRPAKTKFHGVFQIPTDEGRAVFKGSQHSAKVVVRPK
jgi:hypothetical protein